MNLIQRQFRLSRCSRLMVLGLLLLLAAPCLAQNRKLGTIGPPQRQSPQRQTSAEGVPPLPLPAQPMRRSEPKAEPAAPTFIAKLAYGSTQDYMPNPGDLDNLLRHVRTQLDTWYGWQILTLDELVSLHKADKPCKIPALYITGYEAFEFTDEQRAALRDYLTDGGSLIGDAALGSPAFSQSFQREIARIFPQRKLDWLQTDHPVFRGYYQYANVRYFTVEKGVHTKIESVPKLMGLNLAARTAVILSPYDMTCGWDEFYAPSAEVKVPNAPRTMAMMPADALRMGINLVAYVTAQRNFAREQSQTRQLAGKQPEARAAVTIAQLRHHGDWNSDPNSLYQLIRLLALKTSMPVEFAPKPVDAKVQQLTDAAVLVMTGMDEPRLNDEEIDALRRHLQAGGFLFINNTSGFAKFDREARALIARILPDQKLARIPADHKLFSSLYSIQQVRDAGTLKARDPELEAVMIDQRAAIVYSPNDTLGMLKGIHDPYSNAYDTSSARKLALNVFCYAIQH